MQTYHVKVTTGTVWGAGTDANVFIVLYGENDDTGRYTCTKQRKGPERWDKGQGRDWGLVSGQRYLMRGWS